MSPLVVILIGALVAYAVFAAYRTHRTVKRRREEEEERLRRRRLR